MPASRLSACAVGDVWLPCRRCPRPLLTHRMRLRRALHGRLSAPQRHDRGALLGSRRPRLQRLATPLRTRLCCCGHALPLGMRCRQPPARTVAPHPLSPLHAALSGSRCASGPTWIPQRWHRPVPQRPGVGMPWLITAACVRPARGLAASRKVPLHLRATSPAGRPRLCSAGAWSVGAATPK